jgi:hypothetical protein
MNYAELRTYTPELGLFTITGMEDELKPQIRLIGAKNVSDSAFDRAVYGIGRKHLAWFL